MLLAVEVPDSVAGVSAVAEALPEMRNAWKCGSGSGTGLAGHPLWLLCLLTYTKTLISAGTLSQAMWGPRRIPVAPIPAEGRSVAMAAFSILQCQNRVRALLSPLPSPRHSGIPPPLPQGVGRESGHL